MPAIDVTTLEGRIRSKRLDPVYLIVGDDAGTARRLVDGIDATVDESDRPFAVEHLRAGDEGARPIDIAAAARVFPMLGDRRIVVVLRAERLLKPKRSSSREDAADESADADASDGGEEAGDLTPLEDYLANPVPSTTLVFVANEIDRTRRFSKRLAETALVVECRGLIQKGERGRSFYDRREAERQVARELSAAGRTADAGAVRRLVDAAGDDINKLRGDVERVTLFAGDRQSITADDVATVASGTGVVEDFGVIDAIRAGRAERALVEVARRLERGDSPHALLGQLRWWVTSELAGAAPDRVRPAIESLIRTDLALKRSGGDERVLLERLVLELTGRPVPAGYGFRGRG